MSIPGPGPCPGTARCPHYLSTSCYHGAEPGREDLHRYCAAPTGSNDLGQTWVKAPARCKFCGTPCICPCHHQPQEAEIPDEIPA